MPTHLPFIRTSPYDCCAGVSIGRCCVSPEAESRQFSDSDPALRLVHSTQTCYTNTEGERGGVLLETGGVVSISTCIVMSTRISCKVYHILSLDD